MKRRRYSAAVKPAPREFPDPFESFLAVELGVRSYAVIIRDLAVPRLNLMTVSTCFQINQP